MSLNATNPSINETQYNVHSFYGHMMAKRTSQYFQNRSGNASDAMYDKRHFILTRSTYTSSGQYASHWLGDNYREYAYMNYSISGIMNMNMFGIPHVGADICGFFGKFRDDIMCSLWA
jgi:alpha-glucosidase (family GH31 glycosyl hydrolase)